MEDRQLETYFTSIKEDFNRIEGRFEAIDRRFDRIEEKLGVLDGIKQGVNTLLELMGGYDREQKEIKATLWEHGRRLTKLERG